MSCKKDGIHPSFHKEAKVFCNGELVMTTMGTQEEYVVDVWSGEHKHLSSPRAGQEPISQQVLIC